MQRKYASLEEEGDAEDEDEDEDGADWDLSEPLKESFLPPGFWLWRGFGS